MAASEVEPLASAPLAEGEHIDDDTHAALDSVSQAVNAHVDEQIALEIAREDDKAELNQKEMELLFAEMETRLRRSVLKVIRPTIDQVTNMASRFAAMQRKTDRHDAVLHHSAAMELEIDKLAGSLAFVQEQMGMNGQQVQNFEAKTTATFLEVSNHVDKSEQRLEDDEAEIHKMARESARDRSDLQRLQERLDESTSSIWAGIAEGLGKASAEREKNQHLIAELQKQNHNLLEELFGNGRGLTQVSIDIAELRSSVAEIPQLESRIEQCAANGVVLEECVFKCNASSKSVSEKFPELAASVDKRWAQYIKESQSLMNKLTAHHASTLKNVKADVCEEIVASRALRQEIGQREGVTNEFCKTVASSLGVTMSRIDALHRELTTDISETSDRGKKDRVYLDQNLQRMERDAQTVQEVSESACVKLEHLSKVLALVLEGEKMAGALHLQEFVDRCSECWLAAPSDAKRKPPVSHTARSLEKLKPNYETLGRGFAGEDMTSLVPLDGKNGLAKLEYLPGRINYGGTEFDRRGFLLMHHQMLTKARSFLDHGFGQIRVPPPNVHASRPAHADDDEAVQITLQPGAKGGQSASGPAERPTGLPNSGVLSDAPKELKPKHIACGTSGTGAVAQGSSGAQRPGSRTQPQAMGSSGTKFFPLSQPGPNFVLPPPLAQAPLKLPNIHDRGMDAEGARSIYMSDRLPVQSMGLLQLGAVQSPQSKAKPSQFARRPKALTAR